MTIVQLFVSQSQWIILWLHNCLTIMWYSLVFVSISVFTYLCAITGLYPSGFQSIFIHKMLNSSKTISLLTFVIFHHSVFNMWNDNKVGEQHFLALIDLICDCEMFVKNFFGLGCYLCDVDQLQILYLQFLFERSSDVV